MQDLPGILRSSSPGFSFTCAGPGNSHRFRVLKVMQDLDHQQYLFSLWRALEKDRERRAGLCLVKLDVAKAFDSVHREQLD